MQEKNLGNNVCSIYLQIFTERVFSSLLISTPHKDDMLFSNLNSTALDFLVLCNLQAKLIQSTTMLFKYSHRVYKKISATWMHPTQYDRWQWTRQKESFFFFSRELDNHYFVLMAIIIAIRLVLTYTKSANFTDSTACVQLLSEENQTSQFVHFKLHFNKQEWETHDPRQKYCR